MMRTFPTLLMVVLLLIAITVPVLALRGPVVYYDRYYWVVDSTDPTENTGAKVCAKVGTPLIGYSAKIPNVCSLFHPTAKQSTVSEGSNSGFYCDGLPQKGICAQQKNTCSICPLCNQNIDENTVISDMYREMFVECGKPVVTTATSPTPTIPSVLDDLRPAPTPTIQPILDDLRPAPATPAFTPTFFTSLYSGVRLSVLSMYWNMADKQALNRYLGGKWGCDFYQYPLANQKSVDCTKPGDSDLFCQNRLGSSQAKAEYCGADGAGEGLIVCSAGCSAGSVPASCPADPSRNAVRGTNAPVSTCGGTSSTTAAGLSENAGGIRPAAAATSTISLNRPTLQPSAAAAGSSGPTKTVSVQGATAIDQVTVTGQGIANLVITATQLDSLPKGSPASPGSAPVYQYVEISPNGYTSITGAVIGFHVPSSWITGQHMTSDKVRLGKLSNGAWTLLPTTVDREENGQVYFQGTSSSLSTYGIFGTSLPPLVCPVACSLGGDTNCKVTQPYLIMPYQSSEGPLSQYRCSGAQEFDAGSQCSCDPVPVDTGQCPGSCGTGTTICDVTISQGGAPPCEGIAKNTLRTHCFCVFRQGGWQVGSGWGVGLGHNFANT